MKVSVAMATYNGARHLPDQLGSLVNQRRRPDELIISDDASTDATVDIVADFARSAPFRVRLLRHDTNNGVDANFGDALAACEGDVIAMCDQDDMWAPHKLERVTRPLEEDSRTMVVLNDQDICDADLVSSGRTKIQNLRDLGLGLPHYGPGCATTMRSRWRDVVLPLPSSGIPYDTWINKLGHTMGVTVVLDEVLQKYRRHGGNVSDFATSAGRRPTARDARHLYGHGDAAMLWRQEIAVLSTVARRVRDKAPTLGIGVHDIESAVDLLDSRQRSLAMRVTVVERGRPWRVVGVTRMLAKGEYGPFQGWRSAVRDVVRS